MSLETLVLQFQKKDESAFEALYHMYQESIRGVIFNIVRDEAIAEELMQDVFVKAWQKSDSYSAAKGRFFTWLLNIARNASIDKTRSKDFKKGKQNLKVDFFVDILQNKTDLNRQTDAIGLKAFVEKLADKCKKIIELLYFKGFTQKEASETLEIPIGTIKTRNRNCINELRQMLDI
ncbi:MAG: sigma-70 family RNA polymerase sigma factor [Flavobacteriaceae bacterium]|nr:sigma-70 family RNA polymerase sigma factor [Flavobacteriaceae bacterium]